MKIATASLLVILSLTAAAEDEHRHHGAHNHGSATASLAFDGVNGRLEFKSPSESIFGFEHEAKTDKDKKTQAAGLSTLENKIAQIVVFDSKLNCQFTKDKIEVVKEANENHSDTSASFNISCKKTPIGSHITFFFQKFFPKLHDVDLQILADSVQKSAEAKSNGMQVELK